MTLLVRFNKKSNILAGGVSDHETHELKTRKKKRSHQHDFFPIKNIQKTALQILAGAKRNF